MFRLRITIAIVVALFFVGWNVAHAQTVLNLKYPDGEKSSVTVKVSTKQSLTLANMPFDTASEQEMVISSENGKRAEDGTLRQTQKIESLKAKITLPGGVVLEFDSANPNQAPPGTQFDMFLDLIKANSKASWTVVRGKDNKVLSVDGRDKVLESLDESQRELMKRQVDANYLRDQANQEMDKIPNRPLTKGDSWELTETMRLEAGQNMTFKSKYTYQGEIDHGGKKVHKIDIDTSTVEYSVEGDAPLKVVSSSLTPKTLEGVILFDNEKGQVVESRESVQIKGDLKFSVNGTELSGNLDLTMSNISVVK